MSSLGASPQPSDPVNNIMSDQNWKFLMCPNDQKSLAELLREKSDEYDLKGYMDILTKDEARRLSKAVVNEVSTMEGFYAALSGDELVEGEKKINAIWKETKGLQKIEDLTRGEFLELAKIAQESGLIDEVTCEICYKVFHRKAQLSIHMHLKHNQSGSFHKYSCDECDKTYFEKSSLKYHKLVTHGNHEKMQCDRCERQFQSPLTLKRHMQNHDNVKLDCRNCDKTFSRKDLLNRHIKMQHNDVFYNKRSMLEDRKFKDGYRCEKCHEFFLDRWDMICHFEDKKCLHRCDFCGKTFPDKAYLKIHKLAHTGENKFSCKICNKSFSYKSGLMKHNRTIHKHDN